MLLVAIGATAGLASTRRHSGDRLASTRRHSGDKLAGNRAYTEKSAAGEFYKSAALYLLCCGIATVLNILFHPFGTINMFYISPYYRMGQIVFKDIAAVTGNTAGIFIYIAANVAGAYMIWLIWQRVIFLISGKSPRYS